MARSRAGVTDGSVAGFAWGLVVDDRGRRLPVGRVFPSACGRWILGPGGLGLGPSFARFRNWLAARFPADVFHGGPDVANPRADASVCIATPLALDGLGSVVGLGRSEQVHRIVACLGGGGVFGGGPWRACLT